MPNLFAATRHADLYRRSHGLTPSHCPGAIIPVGAITVRGIGKATMVQCLACLSTVVMHRKMVLSESPEIVCAIPNPGAQK